MAGMVVWGSGWDGGVGQWLGWWCGAVAGMVVWGSGWDGGVGQWLGWWCGAVAGMVVWGSGWDGGVGHRSAIETFERKDITLPRA